MVSEHGLLRRMLQRMGSSYRYAGDPAGRMPAPAGRPAPPPVARVPAAPRPATAPRPAPPGRPANGPSALAFIAQARPPANGPSALAFIAQARPPAADAPKSAPPPPASAPPPPAARPAPAPAPQRPAPSALAIDPARALASSLEARGHALLRRDDKLFVARSSELTEGEREQIKGMRLALLPFAKHWSEVAATPMAQFMATPRPTPPTAWRQQEFFSLEPFRHVIVNFETDGLSWQRGNRPVGVTIAGLGDDGRIARCGYFPYRHRGGGNLDEGAVLAYARDIRGKHITNVNTRFDVHMGRVDGVDLEAQDNTVSDIMHTAALLDDRRKRFALDVLAKDYLGGAEIPRVDESRMADYSAGEVGPRAEYQAELVAQLRAKMYPEIEAQDLGRVQALEDAVIYPVVEMEKNGAPIDRELLEQFSAECTRRHDDLLWEIAREVGFAFDHSAKSWQQLFERLGLPPTDGNAEATILGIDHPIVRKGHQASQYASLNSKTFKAYREAIDSDGILRFDINQLRGDDGGTVSGRFSIGYVQQVPNHDNHHLAFDESGVPADDCKHGACRLYPRRLFIPGSGDYLEADAAQIEYRLFAHFANNPEIIEAYRQDPRISFHKMTWGRLQKYKADIAYSHVKNFNFAKQYGARSIKLGVMMKFITEAEGAEIRQAKRWNDPRLALIHEIEDAYRKMMPEQEELLERAAHLLKPRCDEFCKRTDAMHRNYAHRGFVKTLLGRRSRSDTGYKNYIGLNRVLQGTGADIMKQKLVELHRERKRTGFLMRLTVHDAVGGDAQGGAETLRMVNGILNHQSFDLKVPIMWSAKLGRNWAECK